MSIIKRKLSADSVIKVAGSSVGGGIIMQPQQPRPVDCPDVQDCPPGGCVPDDYKAMWFYIDDPVQTGQYTDQTLTSRDVRPGEFHNYLMGFVVDPSASQINSRHITSLCCSDIMWNVSLTDSGFNYVAVNGVLIVINVPLNYAPGVLTATPAVCGVALNSIEYEVYGA